jgi:hypothetical protein
VPPLLPPEEGGDPPPEDPGMPPGVLTEGLPLDPPEVDTLELLQADTRSASAAIAPIGSTPAVDISMVGRFRRINSLYSWPGFAFGAARPPDVGLAQL